MWGTFLSEPLLIVAFVGRYPANKLIRRIPILLLHISSTLDACCGLHIVLVRLSTGYPMDKGRLDTRYSPVRRSPAIESKLSTSLPLDWHVLSLYLAFILCQDLTLHCMISFTSNFLDANPYWTDWAFLSLGGILLMVCICFRTLPYIFLMN